MRSPTPLESSTATTVSSRDRNSTARTRLHSTGWSAAADLVLLDDDFSAMVVTIREGRILLDNIQRAFLYLVGFKVMPVSPTLLVLVFGLPLLLLAASLRNSAR